MDREVRDALWMNLRVEMSRHDAARLNELVAAEREEARGLAQQLIDGMEREKEEAIRAERERVLEIFAEQFADCCCESCSRGRITIRRIRETSR